MFGLGAPEILVIAIIILLIFGAKRLPGIGTGLGQTIKEIRNIKNDLSGNKKATKDSDGDEKEASEEKSLEGDITKSLQKKLTGKIAGQVPGVKRAKQVKDKANKIKNIIS